MYAARPRLHAALLAAVVMTPVAACKSRSEPPEAEEARDDGDRVQVEPTAGAASGSVVPKTESGRYDVGDSCDEELRFARCPLKGVSARDPDTLLSQADTSHAAGDFLAAFACADIASDLVPESVEAHHLRAAALAGLGYHEAAQVAFSMALALDPDDPETLAAAAHFYINVLPPKRRDSTVVGLEYARRGSDRAATRRGRDRSLRATLALLEAQALNDLARSDEALSRVEEALALEPTSLDATHERGVALFNSCRFRAARSDFLKVLRGAPDDPYAHHYMGLIYERQGHQADADAHFDRARVLARGELSAPVEITPEEFRAEVDAAIAALPDDARAGLGEVPVKVEDVPAFEDLVAGEPPFAPTILGLFRGLPEGVEADVKPVPARTIVLYRKNLARVVRTREELNRQIRRTLLHEIGHLRGFDEDELRRRGLD